MVPGDYIYLLPRSRFLSLSALRGQRVAQSRRRRVGRGGRMLGLRRIRLDLVQLLLIRLPFARGVSMDCNCRYRTPIEPELPEIQILVRGMHSLNSDGHARILSLRGS